MKVMIPLLLGTARPERQSEKVARFLEGEAKAFGFTTDLTDVRDYGIAHTIGPSQENEKRSFWKQTMEAADGLIVVTPEYNHSYPGELKIFLDQIYDEYARKPVGLVGVSGGSFGGVRVVEMIQHIFINFGMMVVPGPLFFPNVGDLFNDEGTIKDEKYKERAARFFKELEWYAKVLKAGRDT